MDPDALLDGLDERQRAAVTSSAMPLAVIAPAGSGKTRVLTARVAHRLATGHADPSHVLCVTFTRKAADELRVRLRRSGIRDRIDAGTFHAIAWRLLRDRWSAQGRTPPDLLDRVRPFLRDQLEITAPAQLAELGTEIAWARARLVRPDTYVDAARAARRRTRMPSGRIAERFAAYEQAKARRHVVDFDDLLAACAAAIEGDDAFAAAVRWRFRHLFVDEFQDVNPLQFRLLEAWRGDRWDVFVVGDTHQSIYGWNGADPGLLTGLARHWPALETVVLDRTFRSTPEITAAAAAVIAAAGLPDRHPRSAGSPGDPVRCREHRDELAEVETIAALIRRGHGPGHPWRSFAVLARTHDQIVALDRGLAGLGIPTRVHRQAGLLDQPTVRRVLGRLRDDHRPLVIAFEPAAADLDDDAVEALADAAEEQHTIDPTLTGAGFVAWAHANLTDHDGDADAVAVSTIHAAKGLEWPVVHVAGCEDGFLPLPGARHGEARAEEARLLYVAITRAEREAHLHWCRTRVRAGGVEDRVRSPFLDGFEAATALPPTSTDDVATSHLAQIRTEVAAAPPVDPVLAALRAWRSGRARAARTDPQVVLPDATLSAIAERRPASLLDLESIPGIGSARRARFGDELVAVVNRTTRGR